MKTVLCFGDSNTWGFHAPHGERFPEDIRWGGRLRNMLGKEYHVVEEGLCGRTTVWDDPVENRMAGITYLWPCLNTHMPIDLVIIMLGTNDCKPYFGVSARTIADSAGRLVDTIQRSSFGPDGSAPKVLLIAPISIESSVYYPHIFGKEAEEKSKGFPVAFQAVAQQYGCYFMDAAQYAKPDPADGIHLDAQGHIALSQAVYETVKEILG